MAGWETHVVMDGWKGILNDIPLAIGICWYRGNYVPHRSLFYKSHRAMHLPVFAIILFYVWRLSFWPVCLIMIRHILLDYMTHQRGWLHERERNPM